MKVIFTDVPDKTLNLMKELAETLKLGIEVLEDSEDIAIARAMEDGLTYGRMKTEEKEDFLLWLNKK